MKLLVEKIVKRKVVKSKTPASWNTRVSIPSMFLDDLGLSPNNESNYVNIFKYKDFIVIGKDGCSFDNLAIVENPNDVLINKSSAMIELIDSFSSELKDIISKL